MNTTNQEETMKAKLLILFVSLSIIGFFGSPLIHSAAAKEQHGEEGHHPGEEHHGKEGHHHGHKAHHNGVLCVIEQCEVGHIETLLDGDTLEAWFVGGGHNTDRSVRIKAEEIPLMVSVLGQNQKALILKASPLKLAGEKVGDCSHFLAKADWLKGTKRFEAQGKIVFKGILRKLFIKYPEGYDPEHGHGEH